MIVSGDIVEVYKYERPLKRGGVNNPYGRKGKGVSDKELNRSKVLNKARMNVRRIINANVNAWGAYPKFLTLTFAENIQNIKQANYEFKKFRQRLEYKTGIKLKYVAVVEFQKRGAIHYHVVIFNLPYIPNYEIQEVWKNGFIKINKVAGVDNLGAYVSKYMTKDNEDVRLRGQKSYFCSRGLYKPVELSKKNEIEAIEGDLSQHKVYEKSYTNDYLGNVTYIQYNKKREN